MLRTVDLNLLVPLQAILRLESVSRAGRELGRSQPAMSAVLRKSRTLFGDELLVRDRGRLRITAGGAEVLARLDDVLASATALLSPREFRPERSTRSFTIAASDYVVNLLAAPLAQRFSTEAPGMSLAFAPLQQVVRRRPPDLLIVPPPYAQRSG